MGEVRQDRDVVGDPEHAVARRGRARSSRRPRRRCRRRPSPAASAGGAGRPAWSCARGSASRTPPIRVATVPISPGDRPAASSAATARNDVVVLPSVPVIPTTPRRRDGSPYHQAAASARAAGRPLDDELRQARRRGAARSTIAAAAPAAAAAATKSCPSTCRPGDGHEQRSRRGSTRESSVTPRTSMARQRGGPDRPSAVAGTVQPAARGQPGDQLAERPRAVGLRRREQVGDRRGAPCRSSPRADRRPRAGRRPGRAGSGRRRSPARGRR